MPLVTEMDLPQLDYSDPEMRGERFEREMGELSAQGWLAGSELGWLFILDRDAASFFLRSKATEFPSKKVSELFGITEGPLADAINKNLISIDGDDHRRLRGLVNPAFNSRQADRFRPLMREHLAELWAPMADRGECEFVADFAKHYPSQMITAVVGAPVTDAPRLHDWAMWFQKQFDPAAILEEREAIEAKVAEFHDYVGGLIEDRRSDPGDDLTSILLEATYEGDRLTDDECLNLIMNVFAGGIDTTQAQLAHGLRLFCAHPGQWEDLAEAARTNGTEGLVSRAVEEVLRHTPITPFTARMTTEDVTYEGVTIPAETVLMISTFTANRDPDVIDDPLSFDINADRGKAKVMTFGAGIHNCLGANLARAELQEAFAFLAPRMPGLEAAGEPHFDTVAGVYGLERLPIRWESGAV